MIATASPHHTLRNTLGVPWRHKGKMFLFFVFVVGCAAAITFLLPKVYRSEGKLLVRLGRENMALDPAATVGITPVLTVQQTQENEINSVIEILKSRALAERIVGELGPAAILGAVAPVDTRDSSDEAKIDIGSAAAAAPIESSKTEQADEVSRESKSDSTASVSSREDHEEAVRRFIKKLNVDAARKSNVIVVTYDAGSPELAQDVVTRLIKYFQEDYVRLNRTPGAQEFLSEQTAKTQQRLEEKENQLRKLKDETEMVAPETRQQIISVRIGRLEDELLQANAELASEEAEVKRLEEQLNSLPPTQVNEQIVGFSNEAADGMRQQLYTLQIREQELATKLTEDHPQLQQVRQQITDAKAVLDKEQPERTQTKTGPSKPYEEVNLQLLKEEPILAALKAKHDQLQTQLAEQRGAQQQLNANEMRVVQLEREVQLEEANYRKYSDSLEQSRIDRAMADAGKSNISVVQPATFELKPVRPNIPLNFALAIVVGLAGGLGLAFAADSWHDATIAHRASVRPLDLPPLPTLGRKAEALAEPVEAI
jgi:uncharacterized protein involved in exopolysaccharide biosynthesis